MSNKVSRRKFLSAAGLAAAALAACQPAAVDVTKEEAPPAAEVVEEEATPAVEVEEVAAAASSPCWEKADWKWGFPPPPKKYDPVVEISAPFPAWPTFKPGSSILDTPWYNWYVNEMGLKFNIHWQADGELATQKFQADIAADTLPDIINVMEPQFSQLVEAGALREVKAIWDATASPLVKECHRYPDGKNWTHCFRNSKQELYGLDLGITDKVFCSIGWIRQDWLDKVDMPMPQTVDEWDKVLHAWKDQGVCDYGLAAQESLVSWAHDFAKIFGAWRVMPTCWRDNGNGELVYDSLNPINKEPLALLSKWYKDGLMDPDFHTYGWAEGMNTVADQKAGIDSLPMWATSRLVEIEKANPGAEFAVMPLPAGATGERGRKWTSPVFHSWVFRHGLEDIKVEALINQLNHERDLHINGPVKWNAYGPLDDMGSDGMWAEGHDWEWDENCEIKVLEWQTGNEFRDVGFRHATYSGYQRDADLNRQRLRKADQATLNQVEKYWTQDPGMARQEAAYETLFNEAEFEIEDEFLGNPTQRMGQRLPDLEALENEYFMSIVLGKKPLDAFDEFVAKWHDMGGDEVAEDVNAWYAAQE